MKTNRILFAIALTATTFIGCGYGEPEPIAAATQAVEIQPWSDFVEEAPISIHVVDSSGTILYANARELSELGYSSEDYLDRSIADFHADPDVIATILTILTNGGELRQYPARLLKADGSILYAMINSSVKRGPDGEFVHTRCFTATTTEYLYRKRIHEMSGCDEP